VVWQRLVPSVPVAAGEADAALLLIGVVGAVGVGVPVRSPVAGWAVPGRVRGAVAVLAVPFPHAVSRPRPRPRRAAVPAILVARPPRKIARLVM
jgi:hypothetical protein